MEVQNWLISVFGLIITQSLLNYTTRLRPLSVFGPFAAKSITLIWPYVFIYFFTDFCHERCGNVAFDTVKYDPWLLMSCVSWDETNILFSHCNVRRGVCVLADWNRCLPRMQVKFWDLFKERTHPWPLNVNVFFFIIVMPVLANFFPQDGSLYGHIRLVAGIGLSPFRHYEPVCLCVCVSLSPSPSFCVFVCVCMHACMHV